MLMAAMAIDPRDFEIFKAHYLKHAGTTLLAARCAVCGSSSWTIEGVVLPTAHDAPIVPGGSVDINLGGPFKPMMTMYCSVCFLVRHFMWLPIKKAASGG